MPSAFIGYRLRNKRKLFGLSQREAARLLGVTPTQLMEWESGRRMPTVKNLFKMGALYKSLIEDIYYEERQEAISEIEKNRRSIGEVGTGKPP